MHTENTEIFSGKAQVYANARPGYPDEALDYIRSLVPVDAVFADIGAGTGIFTALLAGRGHEVWAVEPNADMLDHLVRTLKPFPKAKMVVGTAEDTTLPDGTADAITCAQALHWFDPDAFRAECKRIGKPGVLVICINNQALDGLNSERHQKSTDAFFTRPTVREFPNPVVFTRESWLQYMASHPQSPLPSDPGYEDYMAEMTLIFERDSRDGLLRRDGITKIVSERL